MSASSSAAATGPGRRGFADEGLRDGQGDKPRKRAKVIFACLSCHQRKQRCDRKKPCSACVARKQPSSCRYLDDGELVYANQERASESSSHQREVISYLQSIHSHVVDLRASQLHMTEEREMASHRLNDGSRGRRRSSSSVLNSPIRPASSAVQQTQAMSSVASGNLPNLIELSAQRQTAHQREALPLTEISEAQAMPIPRDVSNVLLQRLPSPDLLIGLRDLYVAEINHTRYPLDLSYFDRCFREVQTRSTITSDCLAIVCAALAITCLSAPDCLIDDEPQRQNIGDELCQLAQNAISFRQVDTRHTVCSLVLIARYLILSRKAVKGLSTIHQAIGMALSLNLQKQSSFDTIEGEWRRLTWTYVAHMFRYMSLLLGEGSTRGLFCRFETGPTRLAESLLGTEVAQFVDHRHRLSHIMARISEEVLGQANVSHSRVVLNIEEQLQKWRQEVPAVLAVIAPDRSRDAICPPLVQLRFVLASEFHFVRISLHRPFLIPSFSPQNQIKYARSRQACIQSARLDLLLRSRLAEQRRLVNESIRPSVTRPSVGAYRVALSAIVLTIALIVGGHSEPESSDISMTMDTFAASGAKGSGLAKHILEQYATEEVARAHAHTHANLSHEHPTSIGTPAAPTEDGSAHAEHQGRRGSTFWEAQDLFDRWCSTQDAVSETLSGQTATQVSWPLLASEGTTNSTWPDPVMSSHEDYLGSRLDALLHSIAGVTTPKFSH